MWSRPTVPNGPSTPFSGATQNGFIYGRGTQDDKSLLAAEIAVMVEIKRRNIKLGRDVILLSNPTQKPIPRVSSGCWPHFYPKIDAEFALNEGGSILEDEGRSQDLRNPNHREDPDAPHPHGERNFPVTGFPAAF